MENGEEIPSVSLRSCYSKNVTPLDMFTRASSSSSCKTLPRVRDLAQITTYFWHVFFFVIRGRALLTRSSGTYGKLNQRENSRQVRTGFTGHQGRVAQAPRPRRSSGFEDPRDTFRRQSSSRRVPRSQQGQAPKTGLCGAEGRIRRGTKRKCPRYSSCSVQNHDMVFGFFSTPRTHLGLQNARGDKKRAAIINQSCHIGQIHNIKIICLSLGLL